MLLTYLRHPIGLQVIKNWYGAAGRKELGPGDLLDQKYSTHFEKFAQRCRAIEALCDGAAENRLGARNSLMRRFIKKGRRAQSSLAPKDEHLISLGYYFHSQLQATATNMDFGAANIAGLQRFRLLTQKSPNLVTMESIGRFLQQNNFIDRAMPILAIERPMMTRYGHPIFLKDYPALNALADLLQSLEDKNIITRKDLYEALRERRPGKKLSTASFDNFLNGNIFIDRAFIAGPQLTSLAIDVATLADSSPLAVYAGLLPAFKSPIFLDLRMSPILEGLKENGIDDNNIAAVLLADGMSSHSIKHQLPSFLAGKILGYGTSPDGELRPIAKRVARIAGFKDALFAYRFFLDELLPEASSKLPELQRVTPEKKPYIIKL